MPCHIKEGVLSRSPPTPRPPGPPRRRARGLDRDHGRPQTGSQVPRLAPGVESLGEYQGSGLAVVTYLARHPSGQVVQLSRLLHLVLTGIDGRRTVAEIAEQVTAVFGRTVSVGNIEYLVASKLAPLGLLERGEARPGGSRGRSAELRAAGAEVALHPDSRGGRAVPRAPVQAAVQPVRRGRGAGLPDRVGYVAVPQWPGHRGLRVRGIAPAVGAGGARPDPALHAVPRVRPRRRLPLRRGASRCHRHGLLRDVAGVLHQRHRHLPAGTGRPGPHRPGRRLLQRDLRARADGGIPDDGLRGAGQRDRADPRGDRSAARAVAAVRRVLYPRGPDRRARPVPAHRARRSAA